MIDMTPEAVIHFSAAAKDKHLKFGIIGGGCSGFQYHWEAYDEYQEHMENDFVTKYEDFTFYVDAYSVDYLAGTVIDYVSDLAGSRVEIGNPNTVGGCGCGESISF